MDRGLKRQKLRDIRWPNICRQKGLNPELVPRYADAFIQPGPPYLVEVEKPSKEPYSPYPARREPIIFWVTASKRPLTYSHVAAHLSGLISVGTFSKWYPTIGLIDLDSVTLERAEEVRAAYGMNTRNSILAKSRSPEHCHLAFRPVYNGRPMTARLFQTLGTTMGRLQDVEVYPRIDHAIRAPFGKYFRPTDPGREFMNAEELMAEFETLYEYEMKGRFPYIVLEPTSLELFRAQELNQVDRSWYRQGADLYAGGLQARSTRHDAQARVIYWLFRRNIPPDVVKRLTYEWIKRSHNGFSEDINSGRYATIRAEIRRQVDYFYSNFEAFRYFPDWIHNSYGGWITRPDLETIVRLTGGSLPRIRFAVELVKFSNPRKNRPWIRVHTDYLIQWSSKGNYLRYLDGLEAKGILRRNTAYLPGSLAIGGRGFSKSITFTGWRFQDQSAALLDDGRTPESFRSIVQAAFPNPRDWRALLTASGTSYNTAKQQMRLLYE